MRWRVAVSGPAALALLLLAGPARAQPWYTVFNTNDSGPGSLRDAINQANQAPGEIRFSIPFPATPPHRIYPLTPLPKLQSQSLISAQDVEGGLDPRRGVVLDGSLMTGPNPYGLRIGNNCEIRFLSIVNFRNPAGEGIGIRIDGSGNNVIGVYVGVDETGSVAQGNDTGIVVLGSANVLGDPSGSTTLQSRNLISGNGVGILLSNGAASANVVRRTSVGLSLTGTPLPNTSHGIRVVDTPGTLIGGNTEATRVTIAFNGGDGLRIEGVTAVGTRARHNSIHSNGGLAIDLGGDGVTPNDAGDVDTGPNGLLNFPVVESVTWSGTSAVTVGHFDGEPGRTYSLDFYANSTPDTSGHGEGELHVGTTAITTDAAGQAAFQVGLTGVSAQKRFVSATAADAAGNVSEMSATVEGAGPPPFNVFTVNVADNFVLGPCSAQRCSLNEALTSANLTPNGTMPDLIRFDVPGPGVATIPMSVYNNTLPPTVTEAVEIDGYTQPGSSPNTIPFGAGGLDSVIRVEIVGDGEGTSRCLSFEGAGNSVRGLAFSGCGTAIAFRSDGNVAEGNYLGTLASGTATDAGFTGVLVAGSGNRVGGTTPAARNLISGNQRGIWISGLTVWNNVVEGNLVGTTRDGHGALPNLSAGVVITPSSSGPSSGSARDNRIGGAQAGAGNVISGNYNPAFFGHGVALEGGGGEVVGTTVQGNFIGVDAEGDDLLPNWMGVRMIGGPSIHDNLVGGPNPGERNILSGVILAGVRLQTSFTIGPRANRIEGNWIGPTLGAATGTALVGVLVEDSNDNTIVGNTIRGGSLGGVQIRFSSTGNRISANSIAGSGVVGIDLGDGGVTPNDPGDVDLGPNDLQNFPVVTAALSSGRVWGVFSGTPMATLVLEFFASPTPHASGHGEGEIYLGTHTIQTDASGNASFTASVAPIPSASYVTATATLGPNTSEFGPALAVAAPGEGGAELGHGSREERDLAPGQQVYRLAQSPQGSYEVIVDATAGAAHPLVLERVAAVGSSVLQTGVPTGTGASLSLRWENASTTSVYTEQVRVRSAGCSSSCGPGDRYRIRAYETTGSLARFNNSGSQATVVLLQNPTDHAVAGHLYFWSASGTHLHDEPFSLPPLGVYVLSTSGVPVLAGANGSATASHDGRYGELAGKAVVIEPATGFSFDSAMTFRPR